MGHAVLKPEEIVAQSEAHIDAYLFRGGPDTEKEDIELGEKFGVGEVVKAAWANAKKIEETWSEQAAKSPPSVEEPKPSSFLPEVQPTVDGNHRQAPDERSTPAWTRAFKVAAPTPTTKPHPAPQLEEEQPRKGAVTAAFKLSLIHI